MSSHRYNATTLFSLGFVFTFSLLMTGAHANTETKQLKQVNQQLEKINNTLGSAKAKQNKTQKSLEKVERNIAERTLRQEQTLKKLSELEQRSAKLILEKEELNIEYLQSLDEVKSLLVGTYKLGKQNGLKQLLSQEDPGRIGRFAQYAKYLADSRKKLIDHTQVLATQTASAEAELSKRSVQLAKLSHVLEKDQAYLKQLKQNRLSTLDQLDGEIANQSDKAKKLKRKQARLTKLVNQLAKQSAKKLKQSQAHAKVYSSRKEGNSTKSTQQSAAKAAIVAAGSLPLPVKAKLAARFGQKRLETGIPWSGILLKGKAGTEVRSIAAGEVVYADWLTGYGLLIIIDHGNDLMSLYGHNRSLNKAVGDNVTQQELIAHMGDTAGLRSAALYFEIRHNGKPQDPLKWCRA